MNQSFHAILNFTCDSLKYPRRTLCWTGCCMRMNIQIYLCLTNDTGVRSACSASAQ
uniref:AlNc14C5G737 protein n=1 Tax=Albugo laibachii Nc14 TaxID=890382 RepID=F0W0V7_9STRA|nr:AlNc14C5G737 [Albugo laibachii Nc14]|eukprot:CCA14681.1 AlNc14C5G737 [Albugo laibachii Nc14]